MIKDVYRDYFQKSFTFLYPLLKFKRKKHPRPKQTYMFWPGHPVDSKMLYCHYEKEDTEKWKTFEQYNLIAHERLVECIVLDDSNIVYVFDMNDFSEDYERVIEGKYSKISREAKKRISDYYGVHTPEWVYIESFLFPSKYFGLYAEILQIEEEKLKEVGELCQKYDPVKETFDVEIFNNVMQEHQKIS